MEPGFTSTEFIWIGIAIAVVVSLMYRTEPNSREPDPYLQYGAYRSYGRAIVLTVAEIGLVLTAGAISVFYLGWIAALYLLWPISSLLAWLTWKYFRSTATLPPEISSGLVFLNTHRVQWAPSELQIVANGWGVFGGIHTTDIDAGLTVEALYLHFDDRLYLIPYEEIQSAIPTEISRLDKPNYEDAIKFEFQGVIPFTITVTWPVDEIGVSIARVNNYQSELATPD